ncbi:MAG: hypothetical protein PUA49_03455 [Butyrivibrio sp.]|nr:hypothetical protein [Butyrivibrio sp.]
MAKKIRFPLEMDGGIEVRDIDSLRENFSLQRVMGYLADGKLVTWLRDRYANDLADAIEELDEESNALAKNICDILGVFYDEATEEDLEKVEKRNRKLSILKEITSEPEYIDNVDFIAFEQDDIYDLLDEEVEKIYLCGEKFSIPLAQEGITYVGVNNPVVVIDSKVEVDWDEKHITLSGVKYDDKYQAVVDSAEYTKKLLYEKAEEVGKSSQSVNASTNECIHSSGSYQSTSYINFMLAPADKAASAKNFDMLSTELGGIKYNQDADIEEMKTMVLDMKIVGLADNYLNSL